MKPGEVFQSILIQQFPNTFKQNIYFYITGSTGLIVSKQLDACYGEI